MIFDASSAEVLDSALTKSIHHACIKQLLYGVFGIVLGSVIFRWGYENLMRYAPKLFFFFCLLLLAVFIPGIGITANGARRWIGMFHVSLQPSEFVKYVVPLYFIFLFTQKKELFFAPKTFYKSLLPFAVPLFLILIEPNNGTVGVIVLTLLVLFFLAKIPARLWAVPMLTVLFVGGISALSMPYVRGRLETYLHPERDIRGKGHQPYQAKIASGSGGLFGKGLGKSVQKLSYLPEAQNDYIAAIFAEEFGFIGMCLIIGLYAWLSTIGWAIAMQAHDEASFLAASSITFLLSFQAFMNLGVVSGLLPSTGLNLPFFSQGGSSLIANCAAVGILLRLALAQESVMQRKMA